MMVKATFLVLQLTAFLNGEYCHLSQGLWWLYIATHAGFHKHKPKMKAIFCMVNINQGLGERKSGLCET